MSLIGFLLLYATTETRAQSTDLKTWLLPIVLAGIGASGSWVSYRQGSKKAYEVQNASTSTAITGFTELTKQLQQQLNQSNALIAALQERVDDCVRDRADLRTDLGVLQGKYEVLQAGFQQLQQDP